MPQSSPFEETEALLARLAQRPGVQSTLILSRETGAIVRSAGLASAQDEGDNEGGPPTRLNNGPDEEDLTMTYGTRKAEEVARLVFSFVKSAGDMISELNGSTDETRLLRLRTKRNEMVIVPDSKYLLVVIHDTPPA